MLPLTIPAPDVTVDPNGKVSFEWYSNPRKVFSVTVMATDEVVFAGLFNSSRICGVEYFVNEPPKGILDYIMRIVSK
jgi:hypothetical protein